MVGLDVGVAASANTEHEMTVPPCWEPSVAELSWRIDCRTLADMGPALHGEANSSLSSVVAELLGEDRAP